MPKSYLAAAAAIATVALLASATVALAQNPKLTVRTDWSPWGMHAGLFLAKQKGWFDEAGLDVTISDGKGSSLLMQQVAAGNVDMGWALHGTMAAAICKGLPLIGIAGFGRDGDLGMMVPKGQYKTLKDLAGKKVAYAANSGSGPFLDVFFNAAGTKRSDFNVVNVEPSSIVSTFSSGEVEGAFVGLAFLTPSVAKVRPIDAILMSSVGVKNPGYGLVSTRKVVQEKAAALKKFMPVVVRAWEYAYASESNLDEAIQAIIKQRPNEKLDAEIMRGQASLYKPLFYTERTKGKKFGWMDDNDWRDALTVMEKVGLCKSGWKTADFYTNDFVSEK